MLQHESDNSRRAERCMRREIRESSARSRERKAESVGRERERYQTSHNAQSDERKDG